MPKLDEVQVIPRAHRRDERGWLLKVVDGREPGLPSQEAEVYLTLARPGQTRAGHFHRVASEWFTVIQGEAVLELADVETGARRALRLSAETPVTVRVPPGVAHLFRAGVEGDLLLVAYADRLYDPADTTPFAFEEGSA